jgi:hypothetical protein
MHTRADTPSYMSSVPLARPAILSPTYVHACHWAGVHTWRPGPRSRPGCCESGHRCSGAVTRLGTSGCQAQGAEWLSTSASCCRPRRCCAGPAVVSATWACMPQTRLGSTDHRRIDVEQIVSLVDPYHEIRSTVRQVYNQVVLARCFRRVGGDQIWYVPMHCHVGPDLAAALLQ